MSGLNNFLTGFLCRACFRPAEIMTPELGSMCKRCWKWLGWHKIKNPPASKFGPGHRRDYQELLAYLEDCNENPEVIESRLEVRIDGEIKGEQNVI